MKTLFVFIMGLCICFALPVNAADESNPPTYQVTINITYNSVNAVEAADIVRNALLGHEKACNVQATVTKNGSLTLSAGSVILRSTYR